MKKYIPYIFTTVLMFIAVVSFSQSNTSQIEELHKRIVTLDSHTDTPLMLGRNGFDIGQWNDPRQRGGKIDFPRMKKGGLDAVFFAVFVGQGLRNDSAYQKAYDRAVKLFELIDNALDSNSDIAQLAINPIQIREFKAKGISAVLMGVENGYPIGQNLEIIGEFYERGARYITLCHTKNNDICDSSTDQEEHGGLSNFGRKVVQEMNRLGMMVDVSHISDKAFYDVLETTNVPVIASHSNARAICDNPRNMTDEMLLALRDNGGVVQVCVLSDYVKDIPEDPIREAAMKNLREKYNNFQGITEEEMKLARDEWYDIQIKYPAQLASVSDLVDHIDHIVQLIGVDHVGIGTDFDGGGALSDCYDVTEIKNITAELLRRGYTKNDISKIWAENFLRVFSEVQMAAEN